MQPIRDLNRFIGIVLLAMSAATQATAAPTLFYLDLSGQVLRADADGAHRTVIVKGPAGSGPDGIAVDTAAGHVYWTNMGKLGADDGSIMRAELDGSNVTTIVPTGGTFTPKQLKLDTRHRKLYWSDREGMRVMRANFDGTHIETLIVTGYSEADRKDQRRWCVGIALDVSGGKLYWTQKGGDNAGQGVIKRANLNIPEGEDAEHRSDIEVLFANLPEPIDLELDIRNGWLYWTDRGDNTVSRAPLHPKPGFDPANRRDREILVRGLREAIGIALDEEGQRMFYTSLGGELGTAKLNGKKARILIAPEKDNTPLTGIAVTEVNGR